MRIPNEKKNRQGRVYLVPHSQVEKEKKERRRKEGEKENEIGKTRQTKPSVLLTF